MDQALMYWTAAVLLMSSGLATMPVDAGEPETLQSLRRAAENGDAAATERLGYLYRFGSGVGADLETARLWLQQAAQAGRPGAMSLLGDMYFRGIGVDADLARAVDLYTKAAHLGDAQAQSWMGWAYMTGTGVEADTGAARGWLESAGAQGDAQALWNLVNLEFRHEKRSREELKALALRAVELGSDLAREWLVRVLLQEDEQSALGRYLSQTSTASVDEGHGGSGP